MSVVAIYKISERENTDECGKWENGTRWVWGPNTRVRIIKLGNATAMACRPRFGDAFRGLKVQISIRSYPAESNKHPRLDMCIHLSKV